VCPCNKSDLLLKNSNYDLCFKCGRFNVSNTADISDPIEYWSNLPQTYKDLTIVNDSGHKYVPYFLKSVKYMVYLDYNDLNQSFEYLVVRMNGEKANMETAIRIPFMEFNKVLLAINDLK
jgi:hypothetical protein